MDQQASASYEEWELCNEDGFIYNRMKCVGEETAAGETSNPPDLEVDPAEEERNRRKRKRETLVKLKRKYQREIDRWEILSNNLCALQEKSNQFQSSLPETSSSIETREQIGEDASFIDELLSMEEARESMIQNVSNLCEIAEGMCRTEEEEEKEKFFNLPVWGSPKDLMASLCYDEI
ncbi:hypothetical protein EUTSA_v10027961mg [Eutrema salsugineum]|uniref:Uncharacterized protein n=1 Tax=Eutrema salsugineum TaxID=72664 RepID=V4M3V2_EUTSA|nr:uncharacterized protein LOC18023017 [Eutrema salsugineum]ESQ46928.1 hypothetical protein EUTSA_v10027961mg [Eutrema salsugineum]